jgi:thiamine pyrophosphokinase
MIFLAHTKFLHSFQNGGASIAADGAVNTFEIYINGLARSRFLPTMITGDFVSRIESRRNK